VGALNWHRLKPGETAAAEAILKSGERQCMNACARYIDRARLKGEVWTLGGGGGGLSAVVVYAGLSLMPVLAMPQPLPPLRFLRRFFSKVPVYSLQGREDDVRRMEAEMKNYVATEKVPFDVMCIDRAPAALAAAIPGLVIREPELADLDSLTALHAAYEKEEVLSAGRQQKPAVSRMNTERLFANQRMLVAEVAGKIVGKINTNAAGFTRYQVGGVYVMPEYRGRGIATVMAGEFVSALVASGRGISLFVKKSNVAARRLYLGIGFEPAGDYRINYYGNR